MELKKMALIIAALIAGFSVSASVSACPIEECMPELANQSANDQALYFAQAGDWFTKVRDLKNPSEAVQHSALIAAQLHIAVLEAQNRALRRALETGKEPDYTSVRQLPSYQALNDAISSDILQVLSTGRMPQLEHLERRIHASIARSKLEEAGEALGQPRKPRRIIE
ncbi:hypothetical protein [Pseudomonas aeruginosa]|uniref:hypothetical protein n=1 Tax=Pseudomonas aeruginosa TaxID=287 RepID=UPI0025B03853|nr:hypothetical protein [Pseudomonas aeruginosa]MDN2540133.1 hypothetical protein [Pseudomonas aeruginosa]MDN2545426.1 hypothetical protein [Pseudomonas aeruginosa]MDN2551181.1 hypothetical protein [Pseudomonas aeruginosa]